MREVNLKNKTVAVAELEKFGFEKASDGWRYEKNICDDQLSLTLDYKAGKLFSEVKDNFGEEYVLHLVENSAGGYVGAVRSEYEEILAAFEENCCEENIFRAALTKNLISYVRDKYGDELEFLWEKYPNAAIWRRKDSKKWYGLVMEISERKLGLDSDKDVEILDLRGKVDELQNLIDGVKYFAGYHMNKKSWYTIRLDGSVDFDEICTRLDESYTLAKK
ncbi:MAG: MmcQ/YjbR family DNA-binding protein [Selenomonadaceae bacterium]|nr:MmcQ/YjbR family DNA-binding protein [Selenomonadaceae bacterium]